ncbi:MAG: hypothetical protein WD059_04635 [Balneolaceae bacterium]
MRIDEINTRYSTRSKEILEVQLKYLLDTEVAILNIEKKSFKSITSELKSHNILSESQKKECDNLYETLRTPVVHGLTLRLFEKYYKRRPKHIFEVETSFEEIYKLASHDIITKIHELMTNKVLIK